MSITVQGFVKNGVVVPNAPLPEGAKVEIRLNAEPTNVAPERKDDLSANHRGSGCTGIRTKGESRAVARLTPGELRKMPREQRQTILAAAAQLTEQDYHADQELTGFDALSEEQLDDNETDSR